ncbi:MAG TPA: ABC transporter permease subunit [Caldilineaceae bacterium]|nr:ABC transporter permease subunit [Caldilineaceae bacterium]
MTALAQPLARASARAVRWPRYAAAGLLLALVWGVALALEIGAFPEAWNLGLREPIDGFESWVIGNRSTHPLFTYFFNPLSDGVDTLLRAFENLLLAVPWPILCAAAALIALRAGGWRTALFALVALLYMGMVGLWQESMQTLALMAASVVIALAIGIPLGILAARHAPLYAALRPMLDGMQTMPAFVYLIPVLLFFGVARVPSVVATVIYALPPAIRLTANGIRSVSPAAVEAAAAFGSTARQTLFKVQLPLALPAVLAGVNQTIMMALGMVVIAALIGGGGLGREVLVALQRLRVGQALEAGLAIVFLAVLLDRISYGFGREQRQVLEGKVAAARPAAGAFRLWTPYASPYGYWMAAALVVAALWVVHATVRDLTPWPEALTLSLEQPVDGAVRWMRDHLYQIGDLPIGAGPLSDFLIIYLLNPLRRLLQVWTPWPVMVLGAGLLGYFASGWRLGLFCPAALFFCGLLGLWDETMDTLSQVLVAVAVALALGLPLGVWAARDDRARAVMQPVLDFLQTIPVFVYLVPVIMLFNVGRVPGVIASVLYAVAPMIRLTDLGLRHVPKETLEAADAYGSTEWQRLVKVQAPLAMPAIMLGVNQTVMMVLAMVIIAGLVGGGALGFEAVTGLAKSELGRGVEAGMAIVILAIVLDRITQAWAKDWTVSHDR